MNHTQLETSIKEIQERSQNPRLIHLCEAFRAFMALYASRSQKKGDSEAFEKKLQSSYRTMWESFYEVAHSFGVDAGKFLEHLSNPENLSPEELQAMNGLRHELESIERTASKDSNDKKSRKKVRI